VPDAPETREDLEAVIRRIVDQPDAVEIEEVWDDRSCIFELRVDPDDLGKVIGRQGRTARSLRTLLETRGVHEGVDYGLEILDD
jgi:predicted RNA-binding protein YlqC (UPF0109 family)